MTSEIYSLLDLVLKVFPELRHHWMSLKYDCLLTWLSMSVGLSLRFGMFSLRMNF